MLAKLLLAASIAWPVVLGAGWWSRAHNGPVMLTATVYYAASHVCHQFPNRSFSTLETQWPVCGRCSGLYLSAPFGALLAFATRKRRTALPSLGWFALALLPSAVVFGIEHSHLVTITSFVRFCTALPLGFAAAFFVTAVADLRVH